MTDRAEAVVIVGGGAVGVTIALDLARAGLRVRLLERAHDFTQGASAGTACLIVPSHCDALANREALWEGIRCLPDPESPFALRPAARLVPWLARFTSAALIGETQRTALLKRLGDRSLDLHRTLAREIDTGLVERGVLNVSEDDDGPETCARLAADHRHHGLRADTLDGAAVRELEPTVRRATAGVLFPDEAHVDSTQYVERVAAAAVAAGVQIDHRVEALGLSPDARGVTIRTNGGDLRAETVVLAAGIWSRHLARQVGAPLPLEGAKGYNVEIAGAPIAPTRPLFLLGTRVVVTPLAGRVRLAGTLELGSDPEAVDARRVEAVRRAGVERVEGLAAGRVVGVWRGLRPCLPDGLPAIGRSPASDRVLIATGHAMLGLTLAPITAMFVRALLAGETPHEIAAMAPDRFRLPGSGLFAR